MSRRSTHPAAAVAVVAATVLVSAAACSSGGSDQGGSVTSVDRAAAEVRLNQMQVIGTHNSYHVEPPAEVLREYVRVDPDAATLAYTHAPLTQQLDDQGVRQIELDVHADPAGDLFRPIGTAGFKVLHIEQVDEGSTCETLVTCLDEVRTWTRAHRTAIPVMVQLEIKTGAEVPGPPDSPNMTPELYDALDAEIRSVFEADELVTPDDVRGSYPTLEAAVLAGAWPRVDDVRGRVLFTLDNKRDEYVAGHPSLEGRVAFTPSTPGQPDAAFLKENDPTGDGLARIQDEVRRGYVVRTRADEPVTTPTSGDTTRRDAALASGAHWVSTDEPVPGLSARYGGSTYVAMIPGGTPARCNPIVGPAGCRPSWFEDSPVPVASGATATTGTAG